MLIRTSIFTGITMLALASFDSSAQQTMPKKYDQTCLDNAGKAYIQCMASATSQKDKQSCQDKKVEAEKNCKLK